jgi:DNA-directed RNA polymerase subunit F
MIKSTEVKTLGEVREILEDIPKEEKEENKRAKELLSYIKKFVKTKPEQRKKLNEALHNLNIIKLNPKFISKIIDLMPEDAEDLRKIFFGEEFTLEQDEINAILETIKQNK